MSLRLGVDVGGTFTKAVAFDTASGTVAGQAISPTTHTHDQGVAAGVVEVVERLIAELGADDVDLVTHSTTQAVNAMLEGDVVTVGLIGMARGRDVRKARSLTKSPKIQLADGHQLACVTEFLDTTSGLSPEVATAAVQRLVTAGAAAIAVAEAFSPDDPTNEMTVAQAAADLGLPATRSTEITGLYGLELRAVTAALNASIIPIALRTADVVEAGVAKAGIASPVMVMRGDGGATDLAGFREAPARTLYSGQAASVAGVLRTARIDDAVIVEVGGTSTNVAAIRHGQPALSYVRVASHSTAIRALDVRVIGVAGGSMLRSRKHRVHGVGPRSAHISDMPYASFLTPDELRGCSVRLVSPRPGDPVDYVTLQLPDGRTAAVTLTCAANRLGIVEPGDYAAGDPAAVGLAFDLVGEALRMAGDQVARNMLEAATQALGDLVTLVIKDQKLTKPKIVAVGGGAGGLGRAVSAAMGLELHIPQHSEIISAVGDALSLIRAERERAMAAPTPAMVNRLVEEVEAEAVAAGAAAGSLESRVEHLPDKGAVRVTVAGAVALSSGAVPGRPMAEQAEIDQLAQDRDLGSPTRLGGYWLATAEGRVGLFDRYGDLVLDLRGSVVRLPQPDLPRAIGDALGRHRRNAGPLTFEPSVWVVAGSRCLQVSELTVDAVLDTLALLTDTTDRAAVVVGRE